MSGPTLHETARRVGALVWLEQRLFEVLGGWTGDEPDLEARALFGTHSRHAAWRAGQLAEHLPDLHDLAPGECIRPARDELTAAVSGVQELGVTPARLLGVHQILLPSLASAYAHDWERLSPIADGPLRRTLAMVGRDALEDAAAGDALRSARLGRADDVDEATRAELARLEALVSDST